MATFGCRTFNNHFPNAQSYLYYILTVSPPQGMIQVQLQHKVEGLGLGK